MALKASVLIWSNYQCTPRNVFGMVFYAKKYPKALWAFVLFRGPIVTGNVGDVISLELFVRNRESWNVGFLLVIFPQKG